MTDINATHVIAVVIALIACVTDLRSRRIPNVLTFAAALAGLAFHTINGGLNGSLVSLAGWTVGLLAFLAPFALGGMGGGDIKLVAALGAWLGPAETVSLAIYSVLVAGAAALLISATHGYLRQALSNIYLLLMHWRVVGIRPLHDVSLAGGKGPRLAYAVPVFAGLVATIWLR